MMVPGDPERLGGYWLAARLGAGGRGVVYDAYDDEGRRYAVTVPRGEVAGRRRFERVTCPHLAEVVAVGVDEGVPYVVSEYVDGPDLRRAVELHGPYKGDELAALAGALAAALRALHEAGLTHRGLNPESVLLAARGPKVIELGLPAAGSVDGTFTYLAPEVLTGQEAGAAADVFAWGAVVLFAATGSDPFRGESLGGVMHRVLAVDPDLSVLPDPLRELVGCALAKDPADRPGAGELKIESTTELRPPEGHTGPRSLGDVAEAAYLALTPRQQEEVPGLLLRLLDGDSPHDEGDVLGPLLAAGLLVRRSVRVPPAETPIGKLVAVSDGRVVPATAALYRAWPRLRGWVADERESIPVHRRIREAARHWSEHRRGRSHLFRGEELDTALGWAATKRRHLRLNQLERDFINDSVALSKQRRKLLWPALAALGAVLAVAVSMSVVTVQGQNELRGQLVEANARAVAARAEALRTSDPRTAMRLSVAAWRLSPVFEARAALHASLGQPELGVFTDPAPDSRARYLLRGDELVKWDADAVTVWDVTAGQRVASYGLPPGNTALSDDGRFAEGVDGRPFEVATGRTPASDVYAISRGNRTRVYRGGQVLFEVADRRVALSPDGTRAAVSRLDGRVELWEPVSRKKIATVAVRPPRAPDAAAPSLAFSPDGSVLAVAGRNGVTLVDPDAAAADALARGGKKPRRTETRGPASGAPAYGAADEAGRAESAGSPRAGRTEVLETPHASRGGTVGAERLHAPHGTSSDVPVFSPDGRLLALPGSGEVRVWNVAERRLAGSYPLKDPQPGMSFSTDGRSLRYLSGTGSVVSLDVSGLPAPADDHEVAAFSGNGRFAAKEVGDATELTDTVEHRKLGRIAAAGDLAFDAGGSLLAVAGDPVTVWEVTGSRLVSSIDVGGDVLAVALSPAGDLLATARGGTLETWDVRAGLRVRVYEGAGDVALAFSPDGATLAAGSNLLDLRTGNVTPLDLRTAATADAPVPTALAFSPDGGTLAFGLDGGRVLLWDVGGRTRLGTIETGTSAVEELRFSPDGDLLAIDSGRTSLWDVSTLREVGQVASWGAGLAFSQDGKRLRGVALDGTVRESPVDPALAAKEVCARAGGSLSRAEWSRLIPESSYQEVC
ncbi:WD40 repeat domain-containing serine/threonine-protein kinase [Nonomuraea sp. SYSU D8015]|uniref:WD40 repeat domain-containing serine/threonine-protein kinase n=1 Tax=Nonomuraea sp. SYSU D8015 TaxID=2593644 RepID=UPI0016618450|nr:WD40 repeat domain-containing serine/threonine-protein kinase [Nonomuraea sp. SYSU D8015]